MITTVPHYWPILILVGTVAFFIGITRINLGLVVLVFAMLLSPEVSIGALARRSIIIRIEDVLIIVFFLVLVARTALSKKIHIFSKTPLNPMIALYSVIFFVSTAKGVVVGNLQILQGFFYVLKLFEYFMIFYMVTAFVTTREQVIRLLKAFMITFAIVNIYAVSQIGFTGRVSAPFEGPAGEPNTLGGYQVLLLGIIIGLTIHMPSSRWRWPLIGLALFSLIPFSFTLSRASYMAIIPMYSILIIFSKFKQQSILIGIFIVVVLLGIFFFPSHIKERLSYTINSSDIQESIKPVEVLGIKLDPSTSARIWSWVYAFEKWKEHPFIGYGVTGIAFLDSQYFLVLGELGLGGFVVFLGILIKIFRDTIRIYKRSKDDLLKGLALGFLAGHVGMIVHALTANTFTIIRIMEPYWFLCALVMLIPKLEGLKADQSRESQSAKSHLRNISFLLGRRHDSRKFL
ncbi:MAG: O-antigen ligase family protein [Candidatus Omnitrophica bacterium]|nr:O-antigen ligase family protein [Candidatus Omnitrophota bacterium]